MTYPNFTPPTYPGAAPVPPPPKKSKWGWIAGGIAGAVLVLAGVGGTLVAAGVVDLGDDKPKVTERKPEDHTYGFIADLCGQTPLDDLEDTFAPISGDASEDFSEYEGFGAQSCAAQLYDSVSEKFGDFRLDVTIFGEKSDAKELFEPEGGFEGYEVEKLEGDWMQGVQATMKLEDDGGTRYGVKILDGNMHLAISAYVAGMDAEKGQSIGVLKNVVNKLMKPLVKSEDLEKPPSGNGQSKPKSGEYAFIDDFCEQIDWSSLDAFPFEKLDDSEYTPDDGNGMSQESCDNGSFDDKKLKSNAALIFKVSTHADAKAAEKEYQRSKESMETSHKTVADADGDWSQGKVGEVGGPIRVETSILILDDNLTANISVVFNGDEGTPKAAKKAILDLAEQAMEIHRE